MAEHQIENSTQRSCRSSVERSSYLGQKGESFFLRTSGKGDFKVVNLINRSNFALIDAFFTSKEEARLFADKRNFRIVDYNTDRACSAFPDSEPYPFS